MIQFLLRRFASGLLLILVTTAAVFVLIYSTADSVARNILGQNAEPEQVAELTATLGLDRPIAEQYIEWLGNAATGNLGVSFFTNEPIASALATRLPVTFSVVSLALVVTLIVSVILGIAAATRGGWIDQTIQSVTTASYVFPAMILAIGLVYVFSITLKWVPAIGFVPITQSVGGWFASAVLPAISLAIAGIAQLASQIRGSMLDELNKDYIRTMRSRGLSEGSLLFKHALRNASAPALTVFSLLFIGLFSASFFIERIFAMPGFGSFALNASIQGDLPALMGVTVFSIVLVVIVNTVVDIFQGWLNPKVRRA